MVSPAPAPVYVADDAWSACRELVALGHTIKDAAAHYGIPYERAKKRAQTQSWPTPSRLPRSPAPPAVPAVQAVADGWQARGERLRNRLFDLSITALDSATPSKLTRWDDIERAAKIGERAAGLEKQAQNVVQIAFPDVLSSEVPAFLPVSATEPPKRPASFIIREASALGD